MRYVPLFLISLLAITSGTAAAAPVDTTPVGSDQVSEMNRPTTGYVWTPRAANAAPAAISRTLFLNNCKPGGCQLRSGTTDSRYDYSSIPRNGSPRLTAFAYSDATWQQVVQCVKETFSPFNIQVTTVDPGTAPHMEVMIAGLPTDLGLSNGVGGIAPFDCGYIENGLCFAFSNVYSGNVNEICATAAQEIAHTWSLDHVTEPSDPMTYFRYSGQRFFKNAPVTCGSDCVNGRGPFGQTCSGQVHTCTCGGAATQNSVAIIKSIFGSATPMPPVVKFTSPKDGDKVQAGAPVRVEATAEIGLAKAELKIDGGVAATLTSKPFAFNLPADLAEGAHTIEVVVYDIFELPGKASIQITLAGPCKSFSDCGSTQTCVGGRCVVGPGNPGGIGETCTGNPDCASNSCGDDGAGTKYCVESCTIGSSECPAGFGCLDAGGKGLCWPNGESKDPSGGCAASDNGVLVPVAFCFLFGVAIFGRRRASDIVKA